MLISISEVNLLAHWARNFVSILSIGLHGMMVFLLLWSGLLNDDSLRLRGGLHHHDLRLGRRHHHWLLLHHWIAVLIYHNRLLLHHFNFI